jgi:PAS domain-containing protein
MDQKECLEWIRLVDDYGQAAAALTKGIDGARERSRIAWEALEQHMREHQCQGLFPARRSQPFEDVLERATAASIGVILVADDERRFVELNQAGVDLFGVPRNEIVGRRIGDFFSEAGGRTVPEARASFISEGVQRGICELRAGGPPRRFEYRARANFVPGLHVSVLWDAPPQLQK